MISRFNLFIAFIFLVGCTSQENPIKTEEKNRTEKPVLRENTFASSVEKAHQKESFLKNDVIKFDLLLYFGGAERLRANISLSTDGAMGKYSLEDGTELIYSSDSVFVSENYSNHQRARFSAYTWSYFFLMPYKLNDHGTIWKNYEDSVLNGKAYRTGKLSFEAGIGDAPDDWYIVYAEPESMLINTAAYIVTAGKNQEEAEKDPHAIQYSEYAGIDGIPIAHKWHFYAWRAKEGLTDTLGQASIKNVRFTGIDEADFSIDESFKLVME
jgi:hypothetical protein